MERVAITPGERICHGTFAKTYLCAFAAYRYYFTVADMLGDAFTVSVKAALSKSVVPIVSRNTSAPTFGQVDNCENVVSMRVSPEQVKVYSIKDDGVLQSALQ